MKHIVLQPSFYNKFECIGAECKFNCCTYIWQIDFTKEEFRNIKRRIQTEEFRRTFQNAFIKEKGQDYYYIKFDEKGNCKFLDEDGLCSMYKEVGPENMSLTCKIFPRFCTYHVNRYECFLSVGCEEVVRFLMKEKDGISLEIVEREISDAERASSAEILARNQLKDSANAYWNDLKILLVGVLQNREYTFGERMVVLGLAMKKIDEMEKKGEFIKIAKYIENFVIDFYNIENRKIYNKAFENINKDGSIRAFQTICTYFLNENDSLIEFDKKITDRIGLKRGVIMQNMSISKASIEYDTEKYQQAMEEFEEFIKGKEHWIENVMIEGYLAVRMPFWIEGGIWKNYCAMVVLYSVMLFIWTCLINKNSTEQNFAIYTSIFARNLFHNKEYVKTMEEHLNKTESETLAHMAMLVL